MPPTKALQMANLLVLLNNLQTLSQIPTRHYVRENNYPSGMRWIKSVPRWAYEVDEVAKVNNYIIYVQHFPSPKFGNVHEDFEFKNHFFIFSTISNF